MIISIRHNLTSKLLLLLARSSFVQSIDKIFFESVPVSWNFRVSAADEQLCRAWTEWRSTKIWFISFIEDSTRSSKFIQHFFNERSKNKTDQSTTETECLCQFDLVGKNWVLSNSDCGTHVMRFIEEKSIEAIVHFLLVFETGVGTKHSGFSTMTFRIEADDDSMSEFDESHLQWHFIIRSPRLVDWLTQMSVLSSLDGASSLAVLTATLCGGPSVPGGSSLFCESIQFWANHRQMNIANPPTESSRKKEKKNWMASSCHRLVVMIAINRTHPTGSQFIFF